MAGRSNGCLNLFYRLIKEADLSFNLIDYLHTISELEGGWNKLVRPTESHADWAMLTLSWAAREFSSVIAATREMSPLELGEDESVEIDPPTRPGSARAWRY